MFRMDRTPSYRKWTDMLNRCYCPVFHISKPEYKGCTVCDEWLNLSAFHEWMYSQNWEGMELDKDLIEFGNKIYSPETCCFIPRSLNALFQAKPNSSGLPRGVWANGKKFSSVFTIGGRKHLGTYINAMQAHDVWRYAVIDYLADEAVKYDDRIGAAIRRRIDKMLSDIRDGVPTSIV